MGKPIGQVRGLDRYKHERHGTLIEVLLDPISGAVKEENTAVNGALATHAVHEYVEREPGVFVRRSSRIEFAPSRAGAKPRVMTVSLSNVRVGKVTSGGAN